MTLRDLLVISGLCFLTEDADEAIRLSLTKEVVHLFGEDAFERMDAIEASNEETVEVMLQILRSLAVDQELLDVKAGIPARDAEIAALRKQVETLQAQLVDRSPEMQGTPVDESPNLQGQQQPVSGADLSKALRDLIRGYVNLLENGRDRILEAGGQCDSLDVMEASDPWLKSARAALDQQDADKKDAEQWISVNERLPEIHEWWAGSIAGISDAVLTIDEDDPDTMTVQRLRKGGQGDLTTLYWDNGDSPTHWRSAPSLPGIDAARKEQV